MGINANYMTLNPLYHIGYGYPLTVSSYIKDGNLTMDLSQSNFGIGMTHGFYSGKWYWEILLADKGQFLVGFVTMDTFTNQKTQPHNTTGSYLVYTDTSNNGQKVEENSFISLSNFNAGDGDIIGLALDRDNRKFWVSLNGTFINSGNPAGGSNPVFDSGDITATTGEFRPIFGTYGGQAVKMTLNAGQDSSFVNQKTSGSANATDDNGFGDFYYTPPTGYLSACQNNIPTSTDIDPAGDDGETENPSKQFNVLTYNASGGDSYTGLGFKPDLVWVKWRGGDQSNALFDSTRGTTKVLNSDATNAEATSSGLTSFDTDGFTMGNSYNQSGRDYVAWCWRANGGTTSSNTDGTITSTVQANTKAGFSIVKFTGNGSNNATVGHGLDSAPDFIICKPYGSTLSWHVFHRAMGTGEFILNNNSAFDTRTSSFTESGTTATNFTLGSDASNMNYSGNDTIAYCWHSVEGYSKFGRYEGNQNADGPFIYTGFRPRMIFMKNADTGSTEWAVSDSARDTSNPIGPQLNWDNANAEGADKNVDFLSNGFKIRKYTGAMNDSGTSIYGAWGDVPFKYNNTF